MYCPTLVVVVVELIQARHLHQNETLTPGTSSLGMVKSFMLTLAQHGTPYSSNTRDPGRSLHQSWHEAVKTSTAGYGYSTNYKLQTKDKHTDRHTNKQTNTQTWTPNQDSIRPKQSAE